MNCYIPTKQVMQKCNEPFFLHRIMTQRWNVAYVIFVNCRLMDSLIMCFDHHNCII